MTLQDFNLSDLGLLQIYTKSVEINWEKVQMYIDEIVKTVSFNDTKIIASDVKLYGTRTDSLIDLVRNGTLVIDAILYISSEDKTLFKFLTPVNKITDSDVRASITNLYGLVLFLLIRGNFPKPDEPIPNILLPLKFDPSTVMKKLTTIDYNKMDLSWIKRINLKVLPSRIKNRLKIGIAGFRLLNFVKIVEPIANKDLIYLIREKLCRPNFDIFPLTRSKVFDSTFPSFGKNLLQLISVSYSPEQLSKAKSEKLIFLVPTTEERYQDYQHWQSKLQNYNVSEFLDLE